MKCPKCGSKRVAPILYGMPAYDEELQRQLENEELYLGGCLMSEDAPEYHCFECGKDVASHPVLLNKRTKEMEDYRDIVTSVRFSDGGFFEGYPEVLIQRKKNRIWVEVRPGHRPPDAQLLREMTETEWKELLDKLYCKMYLHEWKKDYIDPNILDGEQWELELKLTNRRVRNYSGSNAFPPYWRELKRIFRPYFREAGVIF